MLWGLNPCSDICRDPAHGLQEAPVVLPQIPIEYRFVMRDPVSKLSQAIQSLLYCPPRTARKGLEQCRTPECPLVVSFATAVDAAATADKPYPEAQRHRRYELPRGWRTHAMRQNGVYGATGVAVEARSRVHVPLAAVTRGKPSMHGVSQSDLECLQRSVERGPELCVSGIVLKGYRSIPVSGVKVGLHPFARKSVFERTKGVDFRHLANHCSSCNPPGPPLRLACARGSLLYGLYRSKYFRPY